MSQAIEIPDLAWEQTDESLPPDTLSKAVRAILALYLLPAFAIVMVVGGVMMLATACGRLGARAAKGLGRTGRSRIPQAWIKRIKPPMTEPKGRARSRPRQDAPRIVEPSRD